VLNLRRSGEAPRFWDLCFGKRPNIELYNLVTDPDCVTNIAGQPRYADKLEELKTQMETELRQQGDPRMFGQGDVFDRYPYSGASTDNFYERYMRGEAGLRAGWVNPSDFEKGAFAK
jgi:hypothetical protein